MGAGKVVGFHAIVVLIDEQANYTIRIQSGQPGRAPYLDRELGEGGLDDMPEALSWAVEKLLVAMRVALGVVERKVARA